MADSPEAIDPDEFIYRRVPPAWAGDPFPSPQAFTPRKEDVEGLSVYRAKFVKSIAEIAYNNRGTSYYVAVLRVRDLTEVGIEIVPSPDLQNGRPGHAHLPAIAYANRKESRVVDFINLLATRLCKVHGPFPGSPPASDETPE